jgi:hypothetical protein
MFQVKSFVQASDGVDFFPRILDCEQRASNASSPRGAG